MVALQYKSFSLSSLFIFVLVFTEYGCGEASKPPVYHTNSGTSGGNDAVSNGGNSGTPEAGSDVVAGTGGSAGGSAGAGGTIMTGGTGGGGASMGGSPPPPSGTGGGGVGGVGGVGGTGPVDSGAGGEPPCFDAGTDPNRNQVQPGNICERLTTIQCAAEACCCNLPGRDYNACKQGMMQVCREDLKIDSISSDPATGFDPVFAAQVFREYEEMASRCDTNVVSWGTSLNGLRGIIKGTIAYGLPCTPLGELGETLDETGAKALASCKDPATNACTHPTILIWTCLPRVDLGGGCITDLNCLEGLYCDNPDLRLLGAQCKVRKTVGSDCQLPNECQSLICKDHRCAEVNQQNVYCLTE